MRRKQPTLSANVDSIYRASHPGPSAISGIFKSRTNKSDVGLGHPTNSTDFMKSAKSQEPSDTAGNLSSSDQMFLQRECQDKNRNKPESVRSIDSKSSESKAKPFNSVLVPVYLTFPGIEGLKITEKEKVIITPLLIVSYAWFKDV